MPDASLSELYTGLVARGTNALIAATGFRYRVPTMNHADSFAWTAKLSAELFRSEEATQCIAVFRARSKAPCHPAVPRTAGDYTDGCLGGSDWFRPSAA